MPDEWRSRFKEPGSSFGCLATGRDVPVGVIRTRTGGR